MSKHRLRYILTMEVDLEGEVHPIEGEVSAQIEDAILKSIPGVLVDSEALDLQVFVRSTTVVLQESDPI